MREEDYNVAKELNPQIGARLLPVKASPSFPAMVMVAAGPNREFIRTRLGGEPGSLLSQSGAQQAFALLKVKGVREYKDGDLDALAEIVAANDKALSLAAAETVEEGEE